ncbi:DEAD/DEAH box helicase [Chryseobacterium mucoviscidosis]|uniref:DEAD/DEAH box helicase n=1 Tax=Chryseobacterium mucoviscidosis TaxID=1945581 RepID=UPI0030192FE7
MENQLFIHANENQLNTHLIEQFKVYIKHHLEKQIYLLTSPLGEKYFYQNEENYLVILHPKHKIVFLNLTDDSDAFNNFVEDFIEDLSSISDKYKYKNHIGRPREWKDSNTIRLNIENINNIDEILEFAKLEDAKDQRISDLLISLLIGSINDIDKIGSEVPETLLEKVKKNIILFDGDQTRFIYQDFSNKLVTIQGLSGTGKTELLLHKLKDLYINEENSKLFFTCHNIALANTLRERIPEFFNFMKVEKQIEWNKRLWVDRAWGSRGDKNSGIYSYICDFYNIPFLRYSPVTDYKKIFSLALEYLENISEENFEYAFDYLLIDERQDFPDVFFKVCEKITRKKVYVAGDIFQDIFENSNKEVLNVDVILNKCYRTDPRTLMFAHAVGLGLFEQKKLNWFSDEEWKAFGYNVERFPNRELHFSRMPIRRFEDIDIDSFTSMEISESTVINTVIDILKLIIQNDNVKPDDIAIIILDDNNKIYDYIDKLATNIYKEFQWNINRAYENKIKIQDSLFISNANNVKGLEFPFVICITNTIKNTYKYRNILYTMLTRSFIKSYLLLNKGTNIDYLTQGLATINKHKFIKTIEPTDREKEEIKSNLVKFLARPQKSYKEFLDEIFDKLVVESTKRAPLEEMLLKANIQKFDEAGTIEFINNVKKYV